MKNVKKQTIPPSLMMVFSVIIGVIFGFIFYLLQQVSLRLVSEVLGIFLMGIGIASLVIPLVAGLIAANENKDQKGFFKFVAKRFAFAVVCVSFALIAGSMVSTQLYCTYGACSEFAGLEILYVFMWIPWMIGISAVLTLAGIAVFFRVKPR